MILNLKTTFRHLIRHNYQNYQHQQQQQQLPAGTKITKIITKGKAVVPVLQKQSRRKNKMNHAIIILRQPKMIIIKD